MIPLPPSNEMESSTECDDQYEDFGMDELFVDISEEDLELMQQIGNDDGDFTSQIAVDGDVVEKANETGQCIICHNTLHLYELYQVDGCNRKEVLAISI